MSTPKQFLAKVGIVKYSHKYQARNPGPSSSEASARERDMFSEINAIVLKYRQDQPTVIVYDRQGAVAHVSGSGGTHTY